MTSEWEVEGLGAQAVPCRTPPTSDQLCPSTSRSFAVNLRAVIQVSQVSTAASQAEPGSKEQDCTGPSSHS